MGKVCAWKPSIAGPITCSHPGPTLSRTHTLPACTGIKEPVKAIMRDRGMGLGRAELEEKRQAEATRERRRLEIEREQTPELLKLQEV